MKENESAIDEELAGKEICEKINRDLMSEICKILKDEEERAEKDKIRLIRQISRIYWGFWKKLKFVKGNSAGFTGLSELLVLKTILVYLKNKGINFKISDRPLTQDTYYFEAVKQGKQIILSHNLSIKALKEKGVIDYTPISNRDCRPDILLAVNRKPIALMQLKIYTPSPKNMKIEVKKCEEMLKTFDKKCLLFFISFHKFGGKTLEIFKEILKEHREKVYLILPEIINELEDRQVSFEESMNRIIERLEKAL